MKSLGLIFLSTVLVFGKQEVINCITITNNGTHHYLKNCYPDIIRWKGNHESCICCKDCITVPPPMDLKRALRSKK